MNEQNRISKIFLSVSVGLIIIAAGIIFYCYQHFLPRLGSDTTFGKMIAVMGPEGTKPVVVVFISVCLTVFVILFIYMLVMRNRKVIIDYLFGILYMLIYLINMLWALGNLNIIFIYVSPEVFDGIVYLLSQAGIILIFYLEYHSSEPCVSRKKWFLVIFLHLFQTILRIISLFLPIWKILWIVPHIVTFTCLCLWIASIYPVIAGKSRMYLIMKLGNCFLFLATFINYCYLDLKLEILMTVLFPICLIAYLIILFVVFLLFNRQQAKQLEEKLALEKEMSKMQAALMASQMRPHFLYNTLTAVQELCYTAPEKAAQLIVRFSNYLRTSIDFMDYKELVPFLSELELIENYMVIQKVRFENDLVYTQEICFSDFQLPPFSVQPLIENAINYGMREENERCEIRLYVYRQEGDVVIEVSNTGRELKEEQLKEYHSISNIRKRLYNTRKGSLQIAYDNSEQKVILQIRIPLEEQENENSNRG